MSGELLERVKAYRDELEAMVKQESEDYEKFSNPLDKAVRVKAYWRHDAIRQCLIKLEQDVLAKETKQ